MVERSFHQDIRGLIAASTFENVIPITVDADVERGNAFVIKCTSVGNVHFRLASGDEDTIPVVEGLTVLPLAVTKVFASGTSASATFSNWI